jgi:hypothetical protein
MAALSPRFQTIQRKTKVIDGRIIEPSPVVLNEASLKPYFSYPLEMAAKELGVCSTSLKM